MADPLNSQNTRQEPEPARLLLFPWRAHVPVIASRPSRDVNLHSHVIPPEWCQVLGGTERLKARIAAEDVIGVTPDGWLAPSRRGPAQTA